MELWQEPIMKQVRQHNYHIISSLPKDDKWPPLSYEMFAICENDKNSNGPDLEYSGRIIHFGANLKSVEQEWIEWKLKFETLLTKLFFLQARVHFKTEYSPLETSSWTVDSQKYTVRYDNEMPDKIKREDWVYESTFDK